MDEKNAQAPYYFHQGTNFCAYEYLGCNYTKVSGIYVYTFRTWAPNADTVELVSDFVGWDSPAKMQRVTERGIWELIYKSQFSLHGAAYKFRIGKNGTFRFKGDPYARFSRGNSDGASIVFHSEYIFSDKPWLTKRKKQIAVSENGYLSCPINVYELHAASFIRHSDNSYYSYRELADVLVPYVKYMGYTHIEFLPLTEYPFDGSWGYQVCAFFAPTSRHGTPDDFKYLVDELHKNGIGVILDWVPAHFPKDEWGLFEFDGSPLYEYQGTDRQESQSWGTRFFDLGREEVQSFLVSSAMYFIKEFHIDGLRVDAVASMIYLDYDKEPGTWIPNINGGRENFEAIAFLKKLNRAISSAFPDVLLIAEESGAHGGITLSTENGGLGFNLKWNMGFANDFFDYLSTDPCYRSYKHRALSFPLMYAFSENYVLPISHDEVVHGKKSFIDKMHGGYEDKFSEMRTALLLIITYPGKKLLFMGTEFAQFREWNFEDSLEWFMLDYQNHRDMREYVAALNHFYLKNSELWELDFSADGFQWVSVDEAHKNSIAYKRTNNRGDNLTVAINFSGTTQKLLLNESVLEMDNVFNTGADIKLLYENNTTYVLLPRFSGAVFRVKNDKIKIKV